MATYVTDVLTATAAPVSGSPTPTRTWQWLRGSTVISGATTNSYTVTAEDLGNLVRARQVETNVAGEASAVSVSGGSVLAFEPAALFELNEPGVYYDPSDTTTLYTDNTGSTLVTAPGQTVGLMLDKSRGLVLGPETVVNGTFDSGTTNWVITGDVTVGSDGRLRMFNPSGGRPVITQAFPTVVGKTYKVTFSAEVFSGGLINCRILRADASTDIIAPNTGMGFFTALDTTTVFYMRSNNTTAGSGMFLDNVSVKELAGNHATQSIFGQRPTYGIVPSGGRRNLVSFSEDLTNNTWVKASVTVPTTQYLAPNGTTTAELMYPVSSGTNRFAYQALSSASNIYTGSVYAKAAGKNFLCLDISGGGPGAYFNLSTGEKGTVAAGYTADIQPAGNGWYRCSVQNTSSLAQSFAGVYGVTDADNSRTVTANGTDGILLWGAQFELGSTATPYQRVTTTFDVTEAGVTSVGYLAFETDKWMVTPTITPGTDKVQVFAGVGRPTATTSFGMLYGHGYAQAGGFECFIPSNTATGMQFYMEPAADANYTIPTAPVNFVLTETIDRAASTSLTEMTARLNGIALVGSGGGSVTGNFLAYQFYLGRRGGVQNPFNGQLFPLIVRFGPNLTAERIAAAESWVSTKTPGVTL